MNRLWTSIVIILTITGIDIWSYSILCDEEAKISEIIDTVTSYCENDDTESALAETENLSDQWEKSRRKMSFFVSDKTLDAVSDSISKLPPLISSGCDAQSAEAEYAKQVLRRTHTREIPYIFNIF